MDTNLSSQYIPLIKSINNSVLLSNYFSLPPRIISNTSTTLINISNHNTIHNVSLLITKSSKAIYTYQFKCELKSSISDILFLRMLKLPGPFSSNSTSNVQDAIFTMAANLTLVPKNPAKKEEFKEATEKLMVWMIHITDKYPYIVTLGKVPINFKGYKEKVRQTSMKNMENRPDWVVYEHTKMQNKSELPFQIIENYLTSGSLSLTISYPNNDRKVSECYDGTRPANIICAILKPNYFSETANDNILIRSQTLPISTIQNLFKKIPKDKKNNYRKIRIHLTDNNLLRDTIMNRLYHFDLTPAPPGKSDDYFANLQISPDKYFYLSGDSYKEGTGDVINEKSRLTLQFPTLNHSNFKYLWVRTDRKVITKAFGKFSLSSYLKTLEKISDNFYFEPNIDDTDYMLGTGLIRTFYRELSLNLESNIRNFQTPNLAKSGRVSNYSSETIPTSFLPENPILGNGIVSIPEQFIDPETGALDFNQMLLFGNDVDFLNFAKDETNIAKDGNNSGDKIRNDGFDKTLLDYAWIYEDGNFKNLFSSAKSSLDSQETLGNLPYSPFITGPNMVSKLARPPYLLTCFGLRENFGKNLKSQNFQSQRNSHFEILRHFTYETELVSSMEFLNPEKGDHFKSMKRGATVRLKCAGLGLPPPRVTWLVNGHPIITAGKFNVVRDPLNPVPLSIRRQNSMMKRKKKIIARVLALKLRARWSSSEINSSNDTTKILNVLGQDKIIEPATTFLNSSLNKTRQSYKSDDVNIYNYSRKKILDIRTELSKIYDDYYYFYHYYGTSLISNLGDLVISNVQETETLGNTYQCRLTRRATKNSESFDGNMMEYVAYEEGTSEDESLDDFESLISPPMYLALIESDDTVPRPPQNVKVTSLSPTSVIIDWNNDDKLSIDYEKSIAEDYANGSNQDLLAYSVHYTPVLNDDFIYDSNNLEKQVIIDPFTTRAIIKELKPATNYTFYVIAYNSFSASSPSKSLHFITSQNNYLPYIGKTENFAKTTIFQDFVPLNDMPSTGMKSINLFSQVADSDDFWLDSDFLLLGNQNGDALYGYKTRENNYLKLNFTLNDIISNYESSFYPKNALFVYYEFPSFIIGNESWWRLLYTAFNASHPRARDLPLIFANKDFSKKISTIDLNGTNIVLTSNNKDDKNNYVKLSGLIESKTYALALALHTIHTDKCPTCFTDKIFGDWALFRFIKMPSNQTSFSDLSYYPENDTLKASNDLTLDHFKPWLLLTICVSAIVLLGLIIATLYLTIYFKLKRKRNGNVKGKIPEKKSDRKDSKYFEDLNGYSHLARGYNGKTNSFSIDENRNRNMYCNSPLIHKSLENHQLQLLKSPLIRNDFIIDSRRKSDGSIFDVV
ncbi:uncharacterized protein LOC135922919 isoform X1 [Gordionus sp. m RMFG-2023]|uniref:uncharacterized protein LOC135922919 isoform X1 n=1 Tax=Gordionus sp. m RMFG-2023 TaxID=3053472 RepID=UPI0031FD9180